jgi:hypothetical protein
LRSRYDGLARNPWNEYECGNYYARAMASYGLLIALSGFRYSAPAKTLYLEPRIAIDPFKVFFSTATGWGTIVIKSHEVSIHLEEGHLDVERLVITREGKTTTVNPILSAVKGSKVVVGV